MLTVLPTGGVDNQEEIILLIICGHRTCGEGGLSVYSGAATATYELVMQPNAPRFLREGDAIEFPAKVSRWSGSLPLWNHTASKLCLEPCWPQIFGQRTETTKASEARPLGQYSQYRCVRIVLAQPHGVPSLLA